MTDQRSVKDILEKFKECGTEVKEIQSVEIEGVHILGLKFDREIPPPVEQSINEKMVKLFPNSKCMVFILDKDSTFVDLVEEHEKMLVKSLEAHLNE